MAQKMITGPVRVSANGRYFNDAQGDPFFWLGDTAWPLYARHTRAEAEAYLQNRADIGFNVVQGVLAWSGGTGFEADSPGPNIAGEVPWLGGNPATPNERYFVHVEYLAAYAAERGIHLAMLPAWGYYFTEVKTLNASNARAYGRWLGNRFRATPNIIWVSGGDRIPTGVEDAYRELAYGLREGDGGAHLITYHPCGWRSSAQFFHGEDWLDFNMIETWTAWPKVYPAVHADTCLLPIKPVVLGEGAYENGPEYPLGPITPLLVRRQAWWAFMAGGFITYGQDQMWRLGPNWTSTFNTPGTLQMGVFKQIVTSIPWWSCVPDQGLFDSGVGSERTLNTAVRALDSTWAMLYLSSQCHVLVHLDKLLTKRVRATWIDPRSGERLDAGDYATGNLVGIWPKSQSQWFSVPGHWEDAVLLLEGE